MSVAPEIRIRHL